MRRFAKSEAVERLPARSNRVLSALQQIRMYNAKMFKRKKSDTADRFSELIAEIDRLVSEFEAGRADLSEYLELHENELYRFYKVFSRLDDLVARLDKMVDKPKKVLG